GKPSMPKISTGFSTPPQEGPSKMHDDMTELFLKNFHEVATIGATPAGGVHRQAATVEDKHTRDWFAAFAAERDWPVVVDHIGNMFALVKLVQDPSAEAILVGSHLDSQP